MKTLTEMPGRFRAQVETLESDCWRWTGYLTPKGYGRFRWRGKTLQAHRASFEIATGEPAPTGLVLDHFRYPEAGCIGPTCVNPGHVRPVTARENTLRGSSVAAANAAKTHCTQGHEFDEVNTYLGRRATRGCRACNRSAAARYKARADA